MIKSKSSPLVLSACLLGASLLVWLIQTNYKPHIATSRKTDSTLISAAEKTAQSISGHLAEAPQPKAELQQTIVNPALADPGNPDNSEDWDQNREWAKKYPAEALKWLENAPDGSRRETMAEIVCPDLAQTDPARAVALAEQCNSSGTNFMKALRDGLGQQWAEQDIQAATAWALAKPVGADRDRLLGRIALVKSKTDPEQAAQWVAELMSPGEVQNDAAISVIHNWALRDDKDALAWAESFPDASLVRFKAILEVENIQSMRGSANFSN